MTSKKRSISTLPLEIEPDADGVNWLTFSYTQKGISTTYKVNVNMIDIIEGEVPIKFRADNSVYPKAAGISREDYKGNRWDYETSVNEIGWKLCFLNKFLVGKRGLLQRAVDSYRNTRNESKSRRVARVEKTMMEGGTGSLSPLAPRVKKKSKKPTDVVKSTRTSIDFDEDRDDDDYDAMDVNAKAAVPAPIPESTRSRRGQGSRIALAAVDLDPVNTTDYDTSPHKDHARLIVETVKNAAPYQFRLRMDMDSIPSQVDKKFIQLNSPFAVPKSKRETLCNDVAWKLAYLNPNLLYGNQELLQRSVDVYLEHFELPKNCPRAGLRLMPKAFPHDEVDGRNVVASGWRR